MRRIKRESIYALAAILCLIYVNYYQTILYYSRFTKMTFFYDMLYQYIASPLYYFFLLAFISSIAMDLLNISIKEDFCRILNILVSIIMIIYFLYVLLSAVKLLKFFPIGFYSIYSMFFSVSGFLFALSKRTK